MTRYFVLDVFSDVPFGGNQLAVFPDATGLPEANLQAIAREFNFSETTFVYPPDNTDNTAKVRIFTPTMEVPFAGHPTIGTAIALAHQGFGPEMVLELGVGPLHCQATQTEARFTTEAPLKILSRPQPDEVAAALGLSPAQIAMQTHTPIMATLGLPFTITELTDRQALADIQTDVGAFRTGAQNYPGGLDFAQFAYWRDGDTIHARMFAPLDNIPEDPATGSACAALGALLAQISGKDQRLEIHQGADMGRPSRIGLATQGQAVTISGAACLVMEGKFLL